MAVDHRRLDGAPVLHRTGQQAVVVAVAVHPLVLQRAVGHHEVEHRRAVGQERGLLRRRRPAAGHGGQVLGGQRRGVRDPGRQDTELFGYPDAGARPGQRPAEHGGLLQHDHGQPELDRGQRGGHPGRARPDDHHVVGPGDREGGGPGAAGRERAGPEQQSGAGHGAAGEYLAAAWMGVFRHGELSVGAVRSTADAAPQASRCQEVRTCSSYTSTLDRARPPPDRRRRSGRAPR